MPALEWGNRISRLVAEKMQPREVEYTCYLALLELMTSEWRADKFFRDLAVPLDVEHRHNVRVLQLGGGARLRDELGDERGVLGLRLIEHLQGDLSVEASLFGAIYGAHAASAGEACEASGVPHRGRPVFSWLLTVQLEVLTVH